MQLVKGSYGFVVNATRFKIDVQPLMNRGGQFYAKKIRWDVSGDFPVSSQLDATQKMSLLENVLSRPNEDLTFYNDSGGIAARLPNLGSITGTRFFGPTWPDSMGPMWATLQRFQFYAEAEYPYPAAVNALLWFSETLDFVGGGPIRKHRLALNTPPQRQLVYLYSIYQVTQHGEASGYAGYPTPPAPIFPDALMRNPNFTRTGPERVGNLSQALAGHQGYKISWNYYFESATPLVGVPNLWI